MYSPSEWSEVYWGLVGTMQSHVDLGWQEQGLREGAPLFVQCALESEQEAEKSKCIVLHEEKLDGVISTFIELFRPVLGSLAWHDGRSGLILRGQLKEKLRELLQIIDARVGEESGIAY